MTVYKVLHVPTGLWHGAGSRKSKHGKAWTRKQDVKLHLLCESNCYRSEKNKLRASLADDEVHVFFGGSVKKIPAYLFLEAA